MEQLIGVAFVIGGIALATVPLRLRRQRPLEPKVVSNPS